MGDGKSIVLVAGIALAAVAFGGDGALRTTCPAVDSHRPVIYHFAITNTTDKAQTVESIRTSCACLKVAVATSSTLPPNGVVPFEVVFDPAGMEGAVQKRVCATLAPSKKIVTFDISENIRLRLGFKPMDAAFGVIKRSETGREIVAKLSGYAADGVKLGEPFIQRRGAQEQSNVELLSLRGDSESRSLGEKSPSLQNSKTPSSESNLNSIFDMRLGADGKSVVAKFRDRNVLPGIYTETWTIPTSDKDIPEIKFAVSARVADAVSVTPQVITVEWDEPLCSRMVMVRPSNPDNPVNPVRKTLCDSASLRENFSILSAETKPRKWGDVKVTQRPLNGWRIDIENIDPREVRQFSKRPFLEVKTDLPGMESFAIPLRVVQNGGTE